MDGFDNRRRNQADVDFECWSKPMNLSHQFELMYMRLFEEHNFDDGKIKILRSKRWEGYTTNNRELYDVICYYRSFVFVKHETNAPFTRYDI